MLTNANTTDTQKGIKSIENKRKMETKIRRIMILSYTLYFKIQIVLFNQFPLNFPLPD